MTVFMEGLIRFQGIVIFVILITVWVREQVHVLILLAGDIKKAYVAPDWRGRNSHCSETGLKFQHFEELDCVPWRGSWGRVPDVS